MPHPLQENPFLWNEFADGKLLFCNAQLLQAVRANQDWRVREFWRVLAVCHTVMVQEKNSECPQPWAWLGLGSPDALPPAPRALSSQLESSQAPGPNPT